MSIETMRNLRFVLEHMYHRMIDMPRERKATLRDDLHNCVVVIYDLDFWHAIFSCCGQVSILPIQYCNFGITTEQSICLWKWKACLILDMKENSYDCLMI